MQRKRDSILLLITLITLALTMGILLGPGCGDDSDDSDNNIALDPGALPVLKVGDTWTQRGPIEGTEYEITLAMQGEQLVEGKDCYVIKGLVRPPMYEVVDKMTAYFDKTTMLPVKMNLSDELAGSPFIIDSVYFYQFTGEQLYPLAEGKEVQVVETETTVTTVIGETETETETTSYIYRVEAVEEVTVPAGTFYCFKVVKYDEDGIALQTSWQSAEVKHFDVKHVDHEDNDSVVELISYSVSF